ncbi:MAG: dTDP-glucose 4,6-dehydratase [Bacteroidetes bacterium]|nr:dTDP-glucose 4,6-dehydratase [Bacteroidota bacterium]
MIQNLHQPRCILVTGGAGFIGANFLHHIVPKFPEVEIINLDKLTYAGNLLSLSEIESASNYQFIHGDICDLNLLHVLFDDHQITTVVHFAAESHVDRSIHTPLEFVQTNVVGTACLLEAAKTAWNLNASDPAMYRFLHVSTDEVFGALGRTGKFSIDTPYAPRSPYSASKASADHFVRAYAETYELPVIISNCSNNYGPFQFPEKLIPLAIVRSLCNDSIPVYSKGENIRDWLHVHDHCKALETIIHQGINGETYLVGGSAEYSNLDLLNILLTIVDEELQRPVGTSQKLITFVQDRPGHDFRYAIDASKLITELGWSPQYTLSEGLRATVRWYLSNHSWLEAVIDESYRSYLKAQYEIS